MHHHLFLSAVSDEYRPIRNELAKALRRAGYKVVFQEEMVETGHNTLIKLARSICRESDIVLHILGNMSGAVPPATVLAKLLKYCGHAKLRRRFPQLFEGDAHERVTYTQWEAWLACFYKKPLLICRHAVALDPPSSDGVATDGLSPMSNVEHLALLKPESGYPIPFRAGEELPLEIQTALLRLHNQGVLPGRWGAAFRRAPLLQYGIAAVLVFVIAATLIFRPTPEPIPSLEPTNPRDFPDPMTWFSDLPTREEVREYRPIFSHKDVTLEYVNESQEDLRLILFDCGLFFEGSTAWSDWPFDDIPEAEHYNRFPAGKGWFLFAVRDRHGDFHYLGEAKLFDVTLTRLVVRKSRNGFVWWDKR